MNNYADQGGSAEVDNPLLDLHNSAKTEYKQAKHVYLSPC